MENGQTNRDNDGPLTEIKWGNLLSLISHVVASIGSTYVEIDIPGSLRRRVGSSVKYFFSDHYAVVPLNNLRQSDNLEGTGLKEAADYLGKDLSKGFSVEPDEGKLRVSCVK